MVRVLRVAALVPFASALSSTHEAPAKRVAIIGAGAGGASTAYHLAQYAANSSIPVNITVFERASYIGGRTTTVNAWDDAASPIELGGSIFVEVNRIMVSATKAFNLSTADYDSTAQLELPDLGIWDGQSFVLVTRQEDGWWEKTKLVWRYGTAPFWTNRLMKAAVGKFLTMYEEPVFPWTSLSDVVEKVGLLGVTGVTGEQFLEANGVLGRFAREVVQASTRVNYASNLAHIHGLETMVCMATTGAMSIHGGNWLIFSHMLSSSPRITTHLNTPVTSLSKQQNGTYHLTTPNTTVPLQYDAVILASPLQFANLTLSPPPAHTPDTIPYTALHTTLFASPHALNPQAFNLPSTAKVPQIVLTTLPDGEDAREDPGSPAFYSISLHDYRLNPRATPPRMEYVYKIFSGVRVDAGFLSGILGRNVSLPDEAADEGVAGEVKHDGTTQPKLNPNAHVSWIHRKLWLSYPREYPRVTFEEVVLDEGLWYTSGIEGFVSTMETSALSGMNVARLVRDGWVAGKGGKEEEKEEEGQSEL
ncbi:prenylcysteine oxidase-like protein 1 precursor [Dothidotthia symphoricarpi CBS 119687]|uniref:Prenylcysteine oxidase-like protein 1 n=1 Tax=Dothidotthia symphoricarpi CBS 119687 TaxID=1392245 RepID=A0A6A6AFW4_9PLEO|nr:prenylcysteine oxidase-like protein 1 precursor [Dothidotthia symphoricarpi CBS 119687]KAF2129827.1 prenylcysteine oxidase-like protein 1 precursor [Dothidotthia symphoricarpi CBS 119687]